ncbi:hypothetical protein [Nitrosomonas sp. Nm51]|uniref:hypothetical protein n=1 Tax=Nitrosomonas sp. Nm51 TaxID=133720 RepID=UPI000B8513C0|nr:hypothetical protein [Nitrosomonas sp. Nm51]
MNHDDTDYIFSGIGEDFVIPGQVSEAKNSVLKTDCTIAVNRKTVTGKVNLFCSEKAEEFSISVDHRISLY